MFKYYFSCWKISLFAIFAISNYTVVIVNRGQLTVGKFKFNCIVIKISHTNSNNLWVPALLLFRPVLFKIEVK